MVYLRWGREGGCREVLLAHSFIRSLARSPVCPPALRHSVAISLCAVVIHLVYDDFSQGPSRRHVVPSRRVSSRPTACLRRSQKQIRSIFPPFFLIFRSRGRTRHDSSRLVGQLKETNNAHDGERVSILR